MAQIVMDYEYHLSTYIHVELDDYKNIYKQGQMMKKRKNCRHNVKFCK